MKEIKKTIYVAPVIKVLEFNAVSLLLAGSNDVNGDTGAQVDEPGDGGDINMARKFDYIDWDF